MPPDKQEDRGYLSGKYAESLGNVRSLPACGGYLLVNSIPDSDFQDGTGSYPFFCCRDWNALQLDMARQADLVSVRLVTDPFAKMNVGALTATFPEICYVYKEHFVCDLTAPLERTVRGHHLRNVRKALSRLEVRDWTNAPGLVSQWTSFYANLVSRHEIQGIARFSRDVFQQQLKVPGMVVLSALDQGEACGMTLWYLQGDVAYYHLGAYNERGYALCASYALFWNALKQFAQLGIRWAALGAGAGVHAAESGLTRFKRGWATGTRPVYFCGKILRPEVYARLSAGVVSAGVALRPSFFPAYRAA